MTDRLPKSLRRLAAAEKADRCDMPIGYGETCSLPGDHDDGCEWPLPPRQRTVPEVPQTADIQDYLRQKGEIA